MTTQQCRGAVRRVLLALALLALVILPACDLSGQPGVPTPVTGANPSPVSSVETAGPPTPVLLPTVAIPLTGDGKVNADIWDAVVKAAGK